MPLVNHMPKTGVGRFDADLQGNTLQITHRFYIVNNSSKPLADHDFDQFSVRFEQLVHEHWEGKFGFKRGNQVVRPEFIFEFIDDENLADTAHYVIDVKNSNIKSELVSRKPPAMFQHLKDQNLYFPAAASFFAGSVGQEASHVLIKNDLPKMFPIYVDTMNGNLSRQSENLLGQIAKQIAELQPGLGLVVTGYGAAKSTARARVVTLLRNAGLNMVNTRSSKKFLQPKTWGKSSRSKWSGHTDYVKVALKSQMDESLFTQSNLFTYPAAVVHEFGHMIGLQDEYACLAASAAQKMVDLDFIDQREVQAYLGNHFQSSRVDSVEAQEGQKQFVKLCNRCGILPPHFGRYTNSVMSAGNVYESHHFVTLWAALCELTGQNDWQIVDLNG